MSQSRVVAIDEIRTQLLRLEGVWKGQGRGSFPTIEGFRYREEMTLTSRNPDEPVLHYHQQTWIISEGEDDGSDSHWESGFILAREDGLIEILNAQESRRVEVLVGPMYLDDEGSGVIEAESVQHAHDERMISTQRRIRFDERSLSYRTAMATTRVPRVTAHLEAELQRT